MEQTLTLQRKKAGLFLKMEETRPNSFWLDGILRNGKDVTGGIDRGANSNEKLTFADRGRAWKLLFKKK